MLNQVWTNLIDNALDAMAPGGTLTLSTAVEGEQVKVTVADDGSGIPADVLPKIFDPFFTTKAQGQGTGLGLDISYRIVVDDHGGRIDVASRPGRTEFFVWLPTHPKGRS
jgi:signal transduction histidine kinase